MPDLADLYRALVVTHFGKWQLRETLNSAHSEQRHVRVFRGGEEGGLMRLHKLHKLRGR